MERIKNKKTKKKEKEKISNLQDNNNPSQNTMNFNFMVVSI